MILYVENNNTIFVCTIIYFNETTNEHAIEAICVLCMSDVAREQYKEKKKIREKKTIDLCDNIFIFFFS